MHELLGVQNTSHTYSTYIYDFFSFNLILVIALFFLFVKCGESEIMDVKCLAPGHFIGSHLFLHGKCSSVEERTLGHEFGKLKFRPGFN